MGGLIHGRFGHLLNCKNPKRCDVIVPLPRRGISALVILWARHFLGSLSCLLQRFGTNMDDTKLAKTSQELLESTAVKRKKVSKIACLKDFRRMYVEGGGGARWGA